MEDGQTSLLVIAQSHVNLELVKVFESVTVPLLLEMEMCALAQPQPAKLVH